MAKDHHEGRHCLDFKGTVNAARQPDRNPAFECIKNEGGSTREFSTGTHYVGGTYVATPLGSDVTSTTCSVDDKTEGNGTNKI
jgi:hypothetical protein